MRTIRHIGRIALIFACIIFLAVLSVFIVSKGKKIFEKRLEHYKELEKFFEEERR